MNNNRVRIYELSRELNLDNRDILAVCEQLQIAAKSHSSTITESEAEQIRAAAEHYPKSTPSASPRRDHGPSRPVESHSPMPSSQKPRKQQILEVRRHHTAPDSMQQGDYPETDSEPASETTAQTAAPPRPPRPITSPSKAAPPRRADASEPPAKPTPRSAPPAKAESKPRLELAGPPSRPTAASERTSPPSIINRPVKRSQGASSPESGSGVAVSDSRPTRPVSPPEERQRIQLVRPTVSRDGARQDPGQAKSEEIQGIPSELELRRPTPISAPSRPKRGRTQREEEEELELENKAAAKTAKPQRKVQVLDDEDEDFFDLDLAAQQTAVDVSKSLMRPPKPKSAKQAKPVAATPALAAQRGKRPQRGRDRRPQEVVQERPDKLVLTGDLTVQEMAQELAIPETEIIKILFFKGIAANINQVLDIETATMVAQELDVEVETAEAESKARKVTEMLDAADLENLERRPPVVTIMGHVDHGKTTLLDSIRQTKVAQGEAGGITQHIGAYHVDVEQDGNLQQVVFLDTPGHEAFTAMRARGARVTDVAILVVAADDGVRPQTIEAISHAKAAEVPIIVAINKKDKERANINRVKQELKEYELVPEEWGGDTVMVPVSAIKGENLDNLLEMILLVSEVEDLYANPNRSAKGTVIEANLDKARGPVATLLVQNGTLRVGDTLVAGSVLGKVRAMVDDRGQHVKAASPSFAVEVLGLSDVPAAGDEFEVFADEKEARSLAARRTDQQRQTRLQQAMASRRVSLNALSDQAREGELKELNLILKADVQGSVEAILGALGQLPQNEVQLRVLLAAPGEITETDVDLATASEAVIIGFNTTLASGARQAADQASVDIREYNIIYKLLEDIEGAMEGMLEPELVEEALGQAEVRAVFPVGRGAVAGCYVQSGKLIRNCKVRIHRGSSLIHTGNLDSLKRMREDAREVNAGYECGVGLDDFHAWQEGDRIEAFRMVTKRRTLSS